ncbi:PREDICTED: uncharacterized protein LOC105462130 [Wasmannia auropunctata]|uniref:uncharacterized protein LOC105462130 n=1 Tax=Wasmannia auropunctata TaxID=64793 RepID=UPI0005EE1F7E|nr:PREDICTED: uncharacterized protein LOC105462130 [Wasmannia auropunctata]
MSFKMACYFGWIVFDIRLIFYIILIDNYVKSNKIMHVAINLLWFFHNVFKFLLINYVCETVSNKASATGNLLNRLLYTTYIYDAEVHEIISQFSLQTVHMPLKFYGIGLFQFGFKFLHRFIMSIATVLVIAIQGRENK